MNRSGIQRPNEMSITLSYTSRKGMAYKTVLKLSRLSSHGPELKPPRLFDMVRTLNGRDSELAVP